MISGTLCHGHLLWSGSKQASIPDIQTHVYYFETYLDLLLLYLAHITGLKGLLFSGVVQAVLEEPSPG